MPSASEWNELSDYLGGDNLAGGKVKETGFEHWYSPNTASTDEVGFKALPGGYRDESGIFGYIFGLAGWWTSSKEDALNAWNRNVYYDGPDLNRNVDPLDTGFSIRCVKD